MNQSTCLNEETLFLGQEVNWEFFNIPVSVFIIPNVKQQTIKGLEWLVLRQVPWSPDF